MTALDERILLVDDDPAVLRVYAKALTARRAVELLREHAFDVIVGDVAMPHMRIVQSMLELGTLFTEARP